MKKLSISLIQMKIEKELEKNIKKIKHFLNETKAEVILFPELALTGYQEKYEFDKVENALKDLAEYSKNRCILLGAPFKKQEKLFNTIFFLDRGKIKKIAEKILLFPEVDDVFEKGERREVLNIKEIKIGIVIGLELRNPEFFRKFLADGAEVFFVFAQWPLNRRQDWDLLLKARAVENKTWIAGVNACGKSFELLAGESQIVEPWGNSTKLNDKEDFLEKELKLNIEISRDPFKTPFLSRKKLFNLSELKEVVEKRRKKGQKMVFTNGCFDILHAGHVSYLESARKLGDFLVVGLNSDASIKKIKGTNRPINPQVERIKVLSSLECVDYIVVFEEETPENLITSLKPDVLVKGEDWEEDQIVGAKFVKSYGGKVKRIRFKYKTSTTSIIEKILKKHQKD